MDPEQPRTIQVDENGVAPQRPLSDTSLRISVCGGGDARRAIASTAARVLRDRGLHVHLHQYGRGTSLLESGHLRGPLDTTPIRTDCHIVTTDLPSIPDLARLHEQVVRPHYVLSDGFGAAPGLPPVVLRRRARALVRIAADGVLIVATRDLDSITIVRDEAAQAKVPCIALPVQVHESPGMEDVHLVDALLRHRDQEGLTAEESEGLVDARVRAHALRPGPTANLRWYHAASLHDSGALWDRLSYLVAVTDGPIDLVARATADGPFAPGLWGIHLTELDRRRQIGRIWVSGPGAEQLRRFVRHAELRIVGDGKDGIEQVVEEANAVPDTVLVTIGDPDPYWMGGLLERLRPARPHTQDQGGHGPTPTDQEAPIVQTSYRPVNVGALRSRNAFIPSFLSSVSKVESANSASSRRPSSMPSSIPSRIARFA